MKNKFNFNYILFILAMGIIYYVPFSTYLDNNKQSEKYAKIVFVYDVNSIPSFFRHKKDYSIGLNSVGCPIFENPNQAFQQAMKDFKEASEFLENELELGPIESEWQAYSNVRAWVPECNEELQNKISLLFYFLNIYKNSYDSSY